jgi:hypothetical protein
LARFSSTKWALAGRQSNICPHKPGAICFELINEPFNVLAHLQAPILPILAKARKVAQVTRFTKKLYSNLSRGWTILDITIVLM